MNEDMALMLIIGNYKDELIPKAINKGYLEVIGKFPHQWYHLSHYAWSAAHQWRVAEIGRLEQRNVFCAEACNTILAQASSAKETVANNKKIQRLRDLKPYTWKE